MMTVVISVDCLSLDTHSLTSTRAAFTHTTHTSEANQEQNVACLQSPSYFLLSPCSILFLFRNSLTVQYQCFGISVISLAAACLGPKCEKTWRSQSFISITNAKTFEKHRNHRENFQCERQTKHCCHYADTFREISEPERPKNYKNETETSPPNKTNRTAQRTLSDSRNANGTL